MTQPKACNPGLDGRRSADDSLPTHSIPPFMKTSKPFAVLLLFVVGFVMASVPSRAATNNPTGLTDKQLEYRLKWNLDTLAGDYLRHGRRDPKWDEPAKAGLTNFAMLRVFSGSAPGAEAFAKMPNLIKLAVNRGCDDPLLRYLYARFVMTSEPHSTNELAEAYRQAAEDLSQSEYPAIRKFYAALRAEEALNFGGNTPPVVHQWRRRASQYLDEAVQDEAMPPTEVYEACEQLLEGANRNVVEWPEFYKAFEPIIFKNWPSESSLYLLKGTFYKDYAWQARGGAYADKVTDQGWRLFGERLGEAERALIKAWELNPHDERIACQMITVELGQGKGRARMELWFKRATDLNPDYYDAFAAKLYYLEPKWYGSSEDMLAFGRECVNSKKWGGHVPLILRDAHESLVKYLPKQQQAGYWKRPEVWSDLKAAFERFFELNPEDKGWHHDYARYAYWAEQWDVLDRQIPLLGAINYDFFGGKDEYDKMVRLAKQHVTK